MTCSSSFPGTGQYVILKRDRSQPKLMVLAATKLGHKCLKLEAGKGCRGIFKEIQRYLCQEICPKNSSGWYCQKNSKKMESWTPPVSVSSAVHFCRSRAHGESSHSWSLTHHSEILWKTHIQGHQPEAVAESSCVFDLKKLQKSSKAGRLSLLPHLHNCCSWPILSSTIDIILLYSTTTAPRSYLSRFDSKRGSNKERQTNI